MENAARLTQIGSGVKQATVFSDGITVGHARHEISDQTSAAALAEARRSRSPSLLHGIRLRKVAGEEIANDLLRIRHDTHDTIMTINMVKQKRFQAPDVA